MFLRPFIKYFRPHLGRLTLAVIGMILVGMLSTAPILLAREAMLIMIRADPALRNDLDQSGDVTAEMRWLLKAATEEAPPAAAADDAPTTGSESLKIRSDRWVAERLGAIYTGPRDAIRARAAAVSARADVIRGWYIATSSARPRQMLGWLVVLLIALTAFKGLASFLSKYELSYTFFLTNLKIQEDIFLNILRQDYVYFNRHTPGYLHSRITSDVRAVRDILDGLMSDGVQQPITLVCMFALLLFLSVKLTLGVMLVLPVVGVLLFIFARILRKNTRKQKKKADQLSSSLTESLTNIRLVKAFGTEEVEIGKFQKRWLALFKYMMARRMTKFGSSPLMESIGAVAVGGVILTGSWMITSGEMSFPDFLIFNFTLSRFYRPLKNLATLTNKWQIARVSAERMIGMLEMRPQLREEPNPLPFERLREGIELRQVSFSYGGSEVLRAVNLHVPAGGRVAFAGPSGSGKTTLVNLVARLFDPREGAVLVDGIDLRKYRVADWRRRLAIVTQDTYLFDDTVAANIAYGTDAVDMERIEAAARAANAHEFIAGLEGGKGYATPVGPGGSRLSGGQRQRLAIARAIYRDPEILILDEATSALDTQSQALVQEALGRLMAGRTTFVVAHRISTIRDVDCIYVLSGGRVVESGSHGDLLARGGLYAGLVSQSEAGVLPESPLPGERPLLAPREA